MDNTYMHEVQFNNSSEVSVLLAFYIHDNYFWEFFLSLSNATQLQGYIIVGVSYLGSKHYILKMPVPP